MSNFHSSNIKEVVEYIKERVMLSDYIGKHVRLSNRGKYHIGLCPFHNEKTPSFTVNNTGKYYHCFGCGAHGDVFSFLQKIQNASFIDVLKKLANEYGIELDASKEQDNIKQIKEILRDFIHASHQEFLKNNIAVDYLKSRGINMETASEHSIGFVTSDILNMFVKESSEFLQTLGLNNRLEHRLIFPISAYSQYVGYGARIIPSLNKNQSAAKYINSPDSILFQKRKLLYGMENRKKYEKLILCEGYTDSLLINQNTNHKAVAPLGTGFTQDQLAILLRMDKSPVICMDGDEAGQRATNRISQIALEFITPGMMINIAKMPRNIDPGTMLETGFNKDFEEIIQSSSALSEYCFSSNIENINNPEELLKAKQKLQEILQIIKHKDVRKTFRDKWSEQLKTFKYIEKFNSRDNRKIKIRNNINANNLYALFGLFMKYISIKEQFLDQFISLQINNKAFSELRNQIIDGEISSSSKLADICLEKIKIYPEHLASEEISKIWLEIYHIYIYQSAQHEIDILKEELNNNFTEENWNKMQKLLQIIQNHIKADSK